MGIEAKALISRVLEPLENRVEVLIAESRLAHSATNDAADIEEQQLMTLLVSFDPRPTPRWSARALTGTFIAAQCMFAQMPVEHELGKWLNGLLNSRVPASLCLVFALPEYSEDVSKQIAEFLENIRSSQHHHLYFAVTVSSQPGDWSHLGGIDGFVLADAGQQDRLALEVFNLLTALMSPGMSACVDSEDLRVVFGSADCPARVAGGVWLPREATFIPASAEDLQRLKNSSAIAFMPSTPLQISSQHQLLNAIRGAVTPGTDFVMIAPYGMLSEPLQLAQIVTVTCMVASDRESVCVPPSRNADYVVAIEGSN